MPKPRPTHDLPTKPCVACGRPFTWRKKWQHVWHEVKYCSHRCRRQGPSRKNPADYSP